MKAAAIRPIVPDASVALAWSFPDESAAYAEDDLAAARMVDLPIAVEPIRVGGAFGEILAIARREELSGYDSAYLELALRQAQPLATVDARLRRACRSAEVALA